MATRYWVGGSGTWDNTNTANWSDSSGGSPGASVPTAVDDVVFDASSNATDYTVTFGNVLVECNDWTVAGPASGSVTFATGTPNGTDQIKVYGSLLYPATGMVRSFLGAVVFAATTTGHTVTTNGVSINSVTFDGAGGGWTLGSALTVVRNSRFSLQVFRGTFSTSAVGNYSVTTSGFNSGDATQSLVGVRQINLNASTITITNTTRSIGFIDDSNFTFNAGTSTIINSGNGTAFFGGGKTFYDVSFTSNGSSQIRVAGQNTYNNLTFTGRSVSGGVKFILLENNQTINGTLTFTGNADIRRLFLFSASSVVASIGKTITLNVAAVSGVSDVDLRDIAVTGVSAPWTGTRIGDCGGNSGVTFTTGATKYWNLAAGGNWSATAWALSSGGAVSTDNFPLAQDSVVIENTGLNTSATITINAPFNLPAISTATRTNAMTLASGTQTPVFYGDLTLSSAVTLTGTGAWTFAKRSGTQAIDQAGKSFTQAITIAAPGCVVDFDDAVTTTTFTGLAGTAQIPASTTLTATTYTFAGYNLSDYTAQFSIQSDTAGTQFTVTQASGTVTATNTTFRDCLATGGATWNAFVDQGNIDAGDNDGWNFGLSPDAGAYEYTYSLRSFTQPKRF